MTKLNRGAYQGELTCPYSYYNGKDLVSCRSKAIRYVEHVTPTRLRYRCRKCGGAFQYDVSNRSDLNPYAAYRKGTIGGKIRRNIENILQGRKLKGGFK